ncbi:hypothetical protein [Subtercola sp. RTI3]|uniref:hypothetical protein n=1 Tax=Subtercola sp. RTI3 TaxID=3048639 RepID=UPI002B23B86C|nr:hypothetical protein [Subtercola sp. RTI3]MEA9985669.1 hypothetical protein [Subtercola sp. RTI3]
MGLIVIGAIVVVAVAVGIFSSHYWGTLHRQVNFSVTSTAVKGKDGTYMIYTNNGVYEDTDSFWNNKWNSSDLYNSLQVGKTYTCDAVGFRNGYLSAYENLISCVALRS